MRESRNGEAVIVRVNVLSDVKGSDHVPVETVIEFATVETATKTGISMVKAFGSATEGFQACQGEIPPL